MSGRVQKESADDSDRVDDAVDPRVQVRAIACASPGDPATRPPAILTFRYFAKKVTTINRA